MLSNEAKHAAFATLLMFFDKSIASLNNSAGLQIWRMLCADHQISI
jgi:hypothetical protein